MSTIVLYCALLTCDKNNCETKTMRDVSGDNTRRKDCNDGPNSVDKSTYMDSASLRTQRLSSTGRRNIRRHRRSTNTLSSRTCEEGDHMMRKSYLHRLGINAELSSCVSTTYLEEKNEVMRNQQVAALSVPMIPPNDNSKHRGNADDRRILLRHSVQYTTDLKFDKLDPTDVEKFENSARISSIPTTLDLSMAWNSFIRTGEDSKHFDTEQMQLMPNMRQIDPLDGAFDLFSLPSDSSNTSRNKSIIRTNRCNDSFTDVSTSLNSSNPDYLSSSFSLLSVHHGIDRVQSMSFSEHSMPTNRRKVSFDSTVKATTIPSRGSYSNRLRSKLWSSSEDIIHNAIRNEFEYAYDGKDWRRICEEKEFVAALNPTDTPTHPAHFIGWPYYSRSMPELTSSEVTMPTGRRESCSDDDSDIHFCGVFGMEMDTS